MRMHNHKSKWEKAIGIGLAVLEVMIEVKV